MNKMPLLIDFDMSFSGPWTVLTKRLRVVFEEVNEAAYRIKSCSAQVDKEEQRTVLADGSANELEGLKVAKEEAREARLAVLDLKGKTYHDEMGMYNDIERAISKELKGKPEFDYEG